MTNLKLEPCPICDQMPTEYHDMRISGIFWNGISCTATSHTLEIRAAKFSEAGEQWNYFARLVQLGKQVSYIE